MKEVVRSACRAALKEAGFIPDDYLVDVESDMDGSLSKCLTVWSTITLLI